MKTLFVLFILILCVFAINANQQEEINQESTQQTHQNLLYKVQKWRTSLKDSSDAELKLSPALVVAGVLCFTAALISSASGIGDGFFFIPIMNLVAGIDLKAASSFSAFMVTGGSIANLINNHFGCKKLIDYDLALLLETCMLLGVSVGVICNKVFPEWLITGLFVVFLMWSSMETCENGHTSWKLSLILREKEDMRDSRLAEVKRRRTIIFFKHLYLKIKKTETKQSFLGRNLGIISIKPCSVEYWILLSLQIPLALVFTILALSRTESLQEQSISNQEGTRLDHQFKRLMFPVMSFLAGLLGGIFGIGGGMIISPLLLRAGIPPQVTAATTSFMVFFSATMSGVQYLLLGMQNTEAAYVFSVICFFASTLGLVFAQKVVPHFRRASIIVFLVGTMMYLTTIVMASFGILVFYIDNDAGKDIGFQLPC
ncbi:Sulfite exporter TauE/SafE family protein 6 [Arabidopsis thaliana]